MNNVIQPNAESTDNKSTLVNIKTSKWEVVKAANRRISQGEIKLTNLIDELHKFALQEHDEIVTEQKQLSRTNPYYWIRLSRLRLAYFLQQPIFHYIVILLVILDLIVVFIDLILAQLSSPCLTNEEMEYYNITVQRDSCLLEYSIDLTRTDLFLFYFSSVLLCLFVLEVFISFYAFGRKYLKSPLYLLDGIIVLTSFILEIYFHYGNIGHAGRAASAIILLRLWKILRAIHAVAHSITIKNRLLIEKIEEAKVLLEIEKEQTEQTLAKQEIRLDYVVRILSTIGKLPTTKQINKYINDTLTQRNKKTL